MPSRMIHHDEADLDYDIDGRSTARATVVFDVAPTSRRKTQARYARQGKPAAKRTGMHRRGNKRRGV